MSYGDEFYADLARSEAGLPPQPISFTGDDIAELEWDNPDMDADEIRDHVREMCDRDMHSRGTCDWCGGMLQQTGSCFTCSSCGGTTGCG